MTGSTDHTTADQEQLVAYLDGELTPEEARQVEQRLGQDEAFRELLKQMQQTWDLLDELPQPTLDDSFTRTTVEMVAVKLQADVQVDQQRIRHRQRLTQLAQASAVAASVLLGFWGVRHWQQRPDRELVQDLSVIERVDLYDQVGDLEFLESLAATDLFPEPVDEESASEMP